MVVRVLALLAGVPWSAVIRHAIGLGAIAAIAGGIWGLAGWELAAITAASPFAGAYIYGELRGRRGDTE